VEIVRFDEEVSVPVSAFGSQFRIGPLTGDESRVRVQVMHIPPGGSIGRHPASARQLFAVIDGDGWVSGGNGDGRDIAAGYGAVWSPGEEHEVRSPGGITAVCVEGEFELWALAVTADIVVSDYDPQWPQWFEMVCERVGPAVQDIAVRIDHVGSTSVPGLAAKPIIDLDIVVPTSDDVRRVIERLRTLGYRWRGDLGVQGREAFRRPADDGLPRHHLYVVVEDNKAHLDHWLLRDLLRQDADARDRYGALKKRNAELADHDIDVYVAAKASFVAELLTRARAERGLPPATYWTPETDIA
jgi:GrpB-like predicted nucleotidyltransferase (UPF0157 family)/quercetin dioxygenase-like cupin family protein